MLVEALEIIRELHSGDLVTYDGQYFRVDSARIWDCPDGGVPIGVAVSGDSSIDRFVDLGEHMISVEPDAELVEKWNAQHPLGGSESGESRKIGQIPISWDPDQIGRAHV